MADLAYEQTGLWEVPHWRDQYVDPDRVHDPRCTLDPRHHRDTPCSWPAPIGRIELPDGTVSVLTVDRVSGNEITLRSHIDGQPDEVVTLHRASYTIHRSRYVDWRYPDGGWAGTPVKHWIEREWALRTGEVAYG